MTAAAALAILVDLAASAIDPHWAAPAKAAFPGRNGAIVLSIDNAPFPEGGLTGDADLFAVSPGTGALQQLTSGPDLDYDPSWSPDGRKLAFRYSDNIWVVNRDGSGLRNLTGAHEGGRERYPSWSPDGKWIVFLASFDPPRGTRLYKMRSDGSGVREVVDLPPSEAGIDWGPRP